MEEIENETAGMDRRTLIKRSAVVGGTLVWATPVVQSLARPAFAATSASCEVITRRTVGGVCTQVAFTADQSCCDFLNAVGPVDSCNPLTPRVVTTC